MTLVSLLGSNFQTQTNFLVTEIKILTFNSGSVSI